MYFFFHTCWENISVFIIKDSTEYVRFMLSLQAKWCTGSIDTFFHIPYHYTTIITTCQINKQSQARIELWIIFTFIFLVKACQFDHFSCCKGTHKYKLRNSCVLPPWILTAHPPKRLTMVCLSISTYPYAYSEKRILQINPHTVSTVGQMFIVSEGPGKLLEIGWKTIARQYLWKKLPPSDETRLLPWDNRWIPIIRTRANSNLVLTRTKIDFPWISFTHLL